MGYFLLVNKVSLLHVQSFRNWHDPYDMICNIRGYMIFPLRLSPEDGIPHQID